MARPAAPEGAAARPAGGLSRAAKTALIGGVVILYLCFVGIIGRFDERNVVTGVIALGRTLLALVALIVGYAATRPRHLPGQVEVEAPGGVRVALGAVAGSLTGLLPGLLVVAANAVNFREIFVSISPGLLDLLAFGQEPAAGFALLVAVGAALGAVGAAGGLLPVRYRKPLLIGLATALLISLFEPLLRIMLDGLRVPTVWLYRRGGLTPAGALLVVVAAVAVSFLRAEKGHLVRERFNALPEGPRKQVRIWTVALMVLVLVLMPNIVGRRISDVLGNVGLYVLLGLGLNIVVGYAGLLDLGYVAFFAVGAYTAAVLTSRESFLVTDEATRFADPSFNFFVALPLIVLVAVVIGVMIGAPVLRLRGDYLAIVTLGFGEIVRTLVLSDWLDPWLGGAQGIIQIPAPPPASLDLRAPERIYYLILAFCLLAAYVSHRLADSRVGRAWAAMREDESVAEAMGISVIKYKLLAFAMGAAVACLGGAFFAAKLGSVFPSSFELQVSINVLAVLVLGGMGSIPGVVVGSMVLVGLPDLLREFAEFRLLIFGAVLVAIMVLRPEGLVPNVRRRRELHAVETEEEQFARRAGEDTATPVISGGAGERNTS